MTRRVRSLCAVAVWAVMLAPSGMATVTWRPRDSCFRIPRLIALSALMATYFSSESAGTTSAPPALPGFPFQEVSEVSRFHLPEAFGGALCPFEEFTSTTGMAPEPVEAISLPVMKSIIVLALYNPALTGVPRHFGYEVAKTGVKDIQVLNEGPDLSQVALDGEVMLAAHGDPGRLSDGIKTIPVPSVLAALTAPGKGLPNGFRGKITLVACHSGEAPIPDKYALDSVGEYLRLGGVSDTWVNDYGPLTRFARKMLLTLDCTKRIGRAKAFLPHSERFATVRVGGEQAD